MSDATNNTLQAIHDLLVADVGALSEAYDTANDSNLASAISTEIGEITHRINLLQRLIFVQQSAKLDGMLPKIQTADAQVNVAIKTASKAADVINGISTFLGYVDKAIDFAKTLAPLAGL